jgi:hypothetical protein
VCAKRAWEKEEKGKKKTKKQIRRPNKKLKKKI